VEPLVYTINPELRPPGPVIGDSKPPSLIKFDRQNPGRLLAKTMHDANNVVRTVLISLFFPNDESLGQTQTSS
jgi:hypothetical protein